MPSLWGCTELLCAHKKCSPPLWVAGQTCGQGPAPLYQGEGSRGCEGCLGLSRRIGCHFQWECRVQTCCGHWDPAVEQVTTCCALYPWA